MKNKQLIVSALCLILLGFANAAPVSLAQAAEQRTLQADPEIMRAPAIQVERGKIISIADGRVLVRGDEGRRYGVVALVDAETYIIAGEAGKLKRHSALKTGQQVTLYYSSVMTRSIPPQAHAYAIITGKPGAELPQYFEVAQVERGEGYVRVLSSTHNLIATIDSEACSDYDRIRRGDKLLVWCSMMTMSIPAQTNAEKVVILP